MRSQTIKRVIVEDGQGKTIHAGPIEDTTVEELKQAFRDEGLFIGSVSVDTVGCASLIVFGKSGK